MAGQFTRRTEDFVCSSCGHQVTGNGYTNHCPNCLWSLHVDINPGDREATCRAPMEPIGVDWKKGEMRIVHRCTECGHRQPNRTAPEDNQQLLIEISAIPVVA